MLFDGRTLVVLRYPLSTKLKNGDNGVLRALPLAMTITKSDKLNGPSMRAIMLRAVCEGLDAEIPDWYEPA